MKKEQERNFYESKQWNKLVEMAKLQPEKTAILISDEIFKIAEPHLPKEQKSFADYIQNLLIGDKASNLKNIIANYVQKELCKEELGASHVEDLSFNYNRIVFTKEAIMTIESGKITDFVENALFEISKKYGYKSTEETLSGKEKQKQKYEKDEVQILKSPRTDNLNHISVRGLKHRNVSRDEIN